MLCVWRRHFIMFNWRFRLACNLIMWSVVCAYSLQTRLLREVTDIWLVGTRCSLNMLIHSFFTCCTAEFISWVLNPPSTISNTFFKSTVCLHFPGTFLFNSLLRSMLKKACIPVWCNRDRRNASCYNNKWNNTSSMEASGCTSVI